jgi:hypothetical protein
MAQASVKLHPATNSSTTGTGQFKLGLAQNVRGLCRTSQRQRSGPYQSTHYVKPPAPPACRPRTASGDTSVAPSAGSGFVAIGRVAPVCSSNVFKYALSPGLAKIWIRLTRRKFIQMAISQILSGKKKDLRQTTLSFLGLGFARIIMAISMVNACLAQTQFANVSACS